MEHVGGNVNGLALNLVGPAAVVSDAGSDGANVTLGHGDGLAIVERLDGGEEVEVLFHEVGELDHHVAPLLGRDVLPRGFKGLASCGDSDVDIFLGGFADRGDDLLGGWIDNLELFLVDTLNPLVVDEAVMRGAVSLPRKSSDVSWKPRSCQSQQTHRPMGCW